VPARPVQPPPASPKPPQVPANKPGEAISLAQRQAQFNQLMATGKQAAAARRYADAAKAFEAALKLVPSNAEARTALQKARDGKP
jgi:hypothetical protein